MNECISIYIHIQLLFFLILRFCYYYYYNILLLYYYTIILIEKFIYLNVYIYFCDNMAKKKSSLDKLTGKQVFSNTPELLQFINSRMAAEMKKKQKKKVNKKDIEKAMDKIADGLSKLYEDASKEA